MRLTDAQCKQLFPTLPKTKRALYRPLLIAAMEEFGITTRKRACAFLAQVGHESQDLAHLKEIWGPTPAQQRYDVRTDLGNTPARDGDGFKYRGRGGIQRTGKKNYQRAEIALELPLLAHPELLERPENAFRSDGLFWKDNGLNELADRLTLKADLPDLSRFDRITKKINGGYNGRIDRQRRYLEAIDALSDEDFVAPGGQLPGDETQALTQKPEPEEEPDFFDRFSANATAKSTSLSLAKKIGVKAGRPIALLLTALQAGNIYAWLGLAVLVVGLIWLIYVERKHLRKFGKWILSKV